jgi:hypothetical protein
MIRLSFVASVVLTVCRHALQLITLSALALAPLAPSFAADVSAPQPSPEHDVNESSGAFMETVPTPARHAGTPESPK